MVINSRYFLRCALRNQVCQGKMDLKCRGGGGGNPGHFRIILTNNLVLTRYNLRAVKCRAHYRPGQVCRGQGQSRGQEEQATEHQECQHIYTSIFCPLLFAKIVIEILNLDPTQNIRRVAKQCSGIFLKDDFSWMFNVGKNSFNVFF